MSPTIPPNQSKLLTSAGHCAAETRVPWRRTGSFRGAQTSDPSSRSTITSSAWTLTQECCFQLQPSNSTKICKKISKAAWMSHLGKWHTYRIHKNNFPSFKRQTKKISINLLLRSFLLRFSFTYKMKTKQWFRVCAHACGGLGKTCGGSALSFHETGSGTRIQAWGQGSWTHFTVINLLILCICASMSTYMGGQLVETLLSFHSVDKLRSTGLAASGFYLLSHLPGPHPDRVSCLLHACVITPGFRQSWGSNSALCMVGRKRVIN